MTRRDKDLRRILDARNDSNIDFDLLVRVLLRLGYTFVITGSHHKGSKSGVPESIVIQPRGRLAKDYQVRQVRRVILQYENMESDDGL